MKNIQYGTEFLDQLKDKVHDLYDENKELKQEIERLKEENYKLQKCLYEEELDVQDQNRELGIRIDKTIEYLKRTDIDFYGNEWLVDALLNILQGSDKE